MKKKGFNLIELLTIMVVAGLLFAISGNTYQTWKAQESFLQTNDRLFELFTTARVNALSEKKCKSGTVSSKWIIQINNSITTKDFRMFCNDTLLPSLEEPLRDSDTDYDLKEVFLTAAMYIDSSPSAETQIEVEFFPGEFQSRINADFVNNDFRIDTTSVVNAGWQKTICFDRVRSYAYFSTTFGSCTE